MLTLEVGNKHNLLSVGKKTEWSLWLREMCPILPDGSSDVMNEAIEKMLTRNCTFQFQQKKICSHNQYIHILSVKLVV